MFSFGLAVYGSCPPFEFYLLDEGYRPVSPLDAIRCTRGGSSVTRTISQGEWLGVLVTPF